MFGMQREIAASAEFARIKMMPSRQWSQVQLSSFTQQLTDTFRTTYGQMTLRIVQAQALLELGMVRGLFAPICVGGGKTLISILAPLVVNSSRPLLLVPAKLVEKTKRDQRELSQHWQVPIFLRVVSYELLGRMQAADTLAMYRPDLIIADEAHKLKNPKAAVTRRVTRYMRDYPGTMFLAMSGTITKRSLKDYARMLRWCLGTLHAPIPKHENELEEWSDALDEKINPLRRIAPGPLRDLAPVHETVNELSHARFAYRNRLLATMGVVATTEQDMTDCSLTIAPLECDAPKEIDAAFDQLRSAWETPDGWALADGMQVWQHAQELALGFYYVWNPRPPEQWIEARKLWARACRQIIKRSHVFDSEGQVANAVLHGEITCQEAYAWWRIKDCFEPNTEIVWLSYYLFEAIGQWAHHDGIVWCSHVQFAQALARALSLPYFGRKGLNGDGQYIEDASGPIIASVASNLEGRNLQYRWARNLITCCPPNGLQWEQLLGRTHRQGQDADEVTADVLMLCAEHIGSFEQARKDAQYIEQTQGQKQKLCYADLLITPESYTDRPGPRWQKGKP